MLVCELKEYFPYRVSQRSTLYFKTINRIIIIIISNDNYGMLSHSASHLGMHVMSFSTSTLSFTAKMVNWLTDQHFLLDHNCIVLLSSPRLLDNFETAHGGNRRC